MVSGWCVDGDYDKRCVPFGGLVLELLNEWFVDQVGKVAFFHVGAANVVIHSVLASDDQARFVRQRDDAAGSEVLVSVSAVSFGVEERREPIAHRKLARVSRFPRKAHDALSELLQRALRIVRTVACNYIAI